MPNEPCKITVYDVENENKKIAEVSYNPTEYSLSKGAQISEIGIPGIDSPLLQFIRGTNEKLTLKLFFDTTDSGKDVRDKTSEFYKLAKMDAHTHALRVCRISWGKSGMIKGDKSSFVGIVESINQNFTLFNPDGIPLRAELDISLKEYKTLKEQVNKLKSYTRTRVLQRGDTLWNIAAKEYKDPSLWRIIARNNNIMNPRSLQYGRIIKIPPVE